MVEYNTRIKIGEWARLRSWWYEIGMVFTFSIFSHFGRRVAYIWCMEKVYHVAKANLQPPPGEERGRSLGSSWYKQIPTYLWYPQCSFEGNKILAWMWRDVAGPNQTPVPHRLFLPWSEHLSLQDLNSSDWLDGTSCFDWCRLANSIFHQISQAPRRARLFVLA